ncbi:mannosyltransferase-like protein [Leptomonas pyrrhocoris]|uniref:Mannosyltransferase-like protein n=1 Tax=Leptomonas pyrrhocoris TaxID=157538 RepID=A0A0N0DY73_LEPPY|nr:mannosyltransferase-like protein [Leptomonas pyrrhocoris]XP_015662210.1 mannosyltransferase-like protein [Leptomonas pyrrhocoris]KPA83770.1 mannosyltransferase-like protein [Leptomonas pyrrhocoris]KPA83771.1 mannosyltransferase-like protein [Leptomonas pyrrhocoris]|eukprot:XP_015662209.1 mannosyltransferase-like protein [Leptomonas pyrrhocoris]
MRKNNSELLGVSNDEAVAVPSPQSGPFQRLHRDHSARVTMPSLKRTPAAPNRLSASRRGYYAKLVSIVVGALLMMCILYNSSRCTVTVSDGKMERLPLKDTDDAAPIVPVHPVQLEPGKANPIALIMPLVGYPLSSSTGVELLRELLQPLLLSEAALCYRADDGAAVPVVAHAVVVSRVSATAVRSAVRGVLAKGSTTAGSAVAAAEAGGSLTSGARWRTWEVSAASVRSALRLANTSDGSGARCLAEAVTVVAHAVEDGGAIYGKEPAETLEVLVDAGLRTRGGGAGTHFVVLPSFLSASRMAYTEPDDASEARRAGTGLLDALLRTATTRNGGRVAAAQCTILATAEQPGSPSLFPPGLVRAELSPHDLQRLQVLEKAAIVGSTYDAAMLVPFLARRFSGYLATDQRASWEEVVDAVSLNCGIFSRSLYNAVGGLAGALSVSGAQHPSSTLPDHVLAAPDRGGWALSLRMQEVYPDWQVWSSRGVAVLRDDLTAGRSSPIVQSLFSALFSLRDAYGRRMHPLLAGLQRRRVGQPWRTRQTQLRMWNSTAVPSHFPAVISYETDFIAPCCGLSREAMG